MLTAERLRHFLVNGDKLDNRVTNLRLATSGENAQNKVDAKSNSKSGVLGVYPARMGKWRTSIGVGGKWIYVGQFKTKESARIAYLQAKMELHPFAPAVIEGEVK